MVDDLSATRVRCRHWLTIINEPDPGARDSAFGMAARLRRLKIWWKGRADHANQRLRLGNHLPPIGSAQRLETH